MAASKQKTKKAAAKPVARTILEIVPATPGWDAVLHDGNGHAMYVPIAVWSLVEGGELVPMIAADCMEVGESAGTLHFADWEDGFLGISGPHTEDEDKWDERAALELHRGGEIEGEIEEEAS
jgi:Ser/Thr protein kinase RdoA (MazF antagonist)